MGRCGGLVNNVLRRNDGLWAACTWAKADSAVLVSPVIPSVLFVMPSVVEASLAPEFGV